ncbi:shikimate kinase [Streptococcus himalayensis]|uniref:Shikimate kinase n=1 Tax=Streptococcus himalayensis TaxID=1888195 RepID=A0A917EEV2_9STRE|nr:shikimate kinase [Streptococcus himalayensis]GGE33586.1 shikimate kinase [Streptococcus himalayensis]
MAKFLLGFMGAGKSTIAALLDPEFVDMDALLVERLGMPISSYFDRYGEESFRQAETELLKELLEKDGWISTGGGIVTRAENRALLKQAEKCVYLQADFDTLYERLVCDPDNIRPLFLQHSREALYDIFVEREPWYEEVASHIVSVVGKKPVEIAEELG